MTYSWRHLLPNGGDLFALHCFVDTVILFQSFDVQEEGSCAAVVESIRAGLVMQLKETVAVTNIVQRQEKINK